MEHFQDSIIKKNYEKKKFQNSVIGKARDQVSNSETEYRNISNKPPTKLTQN